MLRAVIDVNLLVRSALSPTGASAEILNALKRHTFTSPTCRPHLDELNRVLAYPRIIRRYHVTPRRRHRLLAQFYLRSIYFELTGTLRLCRDPNDDYLIELAILGQATHLVTEDKDLREDGALIRLLASRGAHVCGAGEFVGLLTA